MLRLYIAFLRFPLPKKLMEHLQVFKCGGYLVKSLGPDLLAIDLFNYGFRFFGVVPETRIVCLLLFVSYLCFLVVNVKGTPLALPGARPVP